MVEKEFTGGDLLKPKWQKILSKWIKEAMNDNKKRSWVLCYKATRDGFDSQSFHSKCDNQGPTIVVIRSTIGYIFVISFIMN